MTTIHQSDHAFEVQVMATCFNKRNYNRWPVAMVCPQNIEEVRQALALAKSNGYKVSVCSGGHSWSHNHLREGSLLINMKHFNQYEINRDAMTAVAGPGVGGSILLSALMKQNLFFPAGHCKGVCLGGYLLQGGFAWHGRKLGMACESVVGLDIMTADGLLVHASKNENSDLYWAARGSGAGFFGIVIRFHLRLYPKPKYHGAMAHVFTMKHLEHVYRWAYEVGPDIPDTVEFQMLMSRRTMKFLPGGIEAFAPVFADTKDELEAAKSFLVNSPIKHKAYMKIPFIQTSIDTLYTMAMTHYPHNYRWGVDNMWTHASIDELMPYIKEMSTSIPPAPAHMLWLNWQPPLRQDMAFSMEDNIYIALYGSWQAAVDDGKYGTWASERMKQMEHLATGIQLADEGLHQRTHKFVQDNNLALLAEIKQVRDKENIFNEWHSKVATVS